MSHPRHVRVRHQTYPVIGRRVLAGRDFLLLERLSGLRERYCAFDTVARDLRAISVLPLDNGARQQLRVIRRIAQDNPNFPTFIEPHFQRDKLVLVFAWVSGVNLRTLLQVGRRNPQRWPSPFIAFRILKGLAHGISQFHHHSGCVHGDLKPANLLLARSPERIVILDFGSAWTRERTVRRVPGDGQTDPYASPEQHQERIAIDHRSDQFAVAVIAYELLTGELPYDHLGGKAGRPNFIASFQGTLIPPSSKARQPHGFPKHLWPRLDALILRSLALDPSHRYPDRREWLAEVDAIHAELLNQPRPNRLQRFLLHCLDKVTGWVRPSHQTDEV